MKETAIPGSSRVVLVVVGGPDLASIAAAAAKGSTTSKQAATKWEAKVAAMSDAEILAYVRAQMVAAVLFGDKPRDGE